MKKFSIIMNEISWKNFSSHLIGQSIKSYQLPKSQDLECTWKLYLNLDNEFCIEMHSEINSVDGWNEFGVLCANFQKKIKLDDLFTHKRVSTEFIISSVGIVKYKEHDFETECGIQLRNETGCTVTIMSSPAPGAVTVDGFFNLNKNKPEFLLEHCKVEY